MRLKLQKRKKIVDDALKKYVCEKILELNPNENTVLKEDVSVVELVTILGNLVPSVDHFDTLRHLTHYVLQVAGDLQGFSIIWFQENTTERKENSLIDFNSDGYWDKLVTHEVMDHVKIFTFVYTFFQQQFFEKEQQKSLILSLGLNTEK